MNKSQQRKKMKAITIASIILDAAHAQLKMPWMPIEAITAGRLSLIRDINWQCWRHDKPKLDPRRARRFANNIKTSGRRRRVKQGDILINQNHFPDAGKMID